MNQEHGEVSEGKQEPEVISVRLQWVDDRGVEPTFVNAVMSQFTPADEFIVSFGQVIPPNLTGNTIDEIRAVSPIPVRVALRVGLSATRMRELIDILEENYQNYLKQVEQLAPGRVERRQRGGADSDDD